MTLYEFNSLDENSKAEYIWQSCTHLGSVVFENDTYLLYVSKAQQIFFTEIKLSDNKIMKINSFIKGSFLDKYLDKIDLVKLITG